MITRTSLRNFYEHFSGLEGETLEEVATEGYRSMSAVGAKKEGLARESKNFGDKEAGNQGTRMQSSYEIKSA